MAKKKTADQMIGNNDFIDARNNVKTAFVVSIIAAVFAIICINHYKDAYKMQFFITHFIKGDGQDYTNAFVDMLWWINITSFIATAAVVTFISICRFKWPSKYLLLIPAGIQFVCSAVLAFILYTRNYSAIVSKEGVYDFIDGFLIMTIVYLAAHLLLLVSILLPGKLLKTTALIGIVLLTGVGIVSFFVAAPYGISYQLFSSKQATPFSYRALSAQIAEFAYAISLYLMATGLDVYNRCMKEDKESTPVQNA